MDALLLGQIYDSLTQGDIPKFAGYTLIFIFLWIEVRGLKKEFIKLNKTIGESFAAGEDRFKKIETRLSSLELTRT